ncbi:MAG: hypothetical protein PHX94_08380 [Bacteroidales bacterium]|jgi:hypothetical protein|nr:hypothetical protein [Bacteroidales bacterium]HOF20619.1 hypothetical protein [Bacteroidales bacterium]
MKVNEQESDLKTPEVYEPPEIEVTDMAIEQNVLDAGSGNVGDFGGSDW